MDAWADTLRTSRAASRLRGGEPLSQDGVHLHHLLPPDRLVHLDHDPDGEEDPCTARIPHGPDHVRARREGSHGGPREYRDHRDVALEYSFQYRGVSSEPGHLHPAGLNLLRDGVCAH